LLRLVDAEGNLAIGKLTEPNRATLDNLRVQIVLNAGKLEVPTFSMSALAVRSPAVFRSMQAIRHVDPGGCTSMARGLALAR